MGRRLRRYTFAVFALLVVVANAANAAEQASPAEVSDPTAPLSWVEPSKPEPVQRTRTYPVPKLQSIICSSDTVCNAVLNSTRVKAGQWVSGYLVKTIEQQQVVLVRHGKRWVLTPFHPALKQ